MSDSPEKIVIGGVTFELRPHHRFPSQHNRVCLRKNRHLVERYLDLAKELKRGNIVEMGVDQGGGTIFLAKLFKPRKLLAADIAEGPVKKLEKLIADQRLNREVEVHWQVDQSNRQLVTSLVDAAFGDEPLDLVVDDASHLLEPTTATFEILFPRVRPGGRYIIEDWSMAHIWERAISDKLQSSDDGEQVASQARGEDDPEWMSSPMSRLICQLVIASSFRPEWVSEVTVFDGYCEVLRGKGAIPVDSSIRDYTGGRGAEVFCA